jgi:hypothetical protein
VARRQARKLASRPRVGEVATRPVRPSRSRSPRWAKVTATCSVITTWAAPPYYRWRSWTSRWVSSGRPRATDRARAAPNHDQGSLGSQRSRSCDTCTSRKCVGRRPARVPQAAAPRLRCHHAAAVTADQNAFGEHGRSVTSLSLRRARPSAALWARVQQGAVGAAALRSRVTQGSSKAGTCRGPSSTSSPSRMTRAWAARACCAE